MAPKHKANAASLVIRFLTSRNGVVLISGRGRGRAFHMDRTRLGSTSSGQGGGRGDAIGIHDGQEDRASSIDRTSFRRAARSFGSRDRLSIERAERATRWGSGLSIPWHADAGPRGGDRRQHRGHGANASLHRNRRWAFHSAGLWRGGVARRGRLGHLRPLHVVAFTPGGEGHDLSMGVALEDQAFARLALEEEYVGDFRQQRLK